MGEITTAVKYGMNITHVLLNNSELGKISKEQRDGRLGGVADVAPQPRVSPPTPSPCAGRSGSGWRKADALDDALNARALGHDGPALVEVLADAELI